MQPKQLIASMVLGICIFLTVTASSQPVPDGQYPSGPGYLGPNYPPDMSNTGPNYPGPQSGPGMTPSPADGEGGHPASGPDSLQPLSAPSGSSTEALSYAEGQSLSQQDVALSGGLSGGSGSGEMAFMLVSGLQVWTRYNGMWTTDPAAVFFWRSTSLLSYNDQAQNVWSWERYPNGQQSWRNLGYRMPGYFHGRFIGDARGWHELAMWGSISGWSNVVWIYVW